MLNNKEIQSAIDNGDIQIFYSSFKEDLSFDKETNFNDTDKSNLYSDRLKLTLGIIIKSHKKRPINLKTRFKGFSNCIDLRKNGNKYLLEPNESITILTNEKISLSGSYSAIVMPKVSLFEVGIVLTPAYIDPYYNGILRLLITNNSDSSFELKISEVIAQCYFFKFPESVSETFKDTFSHKSVFYGQNWNSIITEDRSPFPTKKNSSSDSLFGNFLSQFKNIYYWLKEHALIASIIGLVSLGYAGYKQIKSDIEDNKTDIKTQTTNITKISSTIENLKKDFQLEKSEIIIKTGQKTGQKEITIEIPKKEIISVLCPNDLIKCEIRSGQSANESIITFSYETKNVVKEDTKVEFEYSILKELK